MYNATTNETFSETFKAARLLSPLIAANTSENVPEGAECYLHEDGLSGFAIGASGELTNVFSLRRLRGAVLLTHAIYRGATHLDCFDGPLVTLYKAHGFVEVGSEQNWGGAHLPRVVYMALAAEPHAALQSNIEA